MADTEFSQKLLLDTLNRVDANSQQAAIDSAATRSEFTALKEELLERTVPDIKARLSRLEQRPVHKPTSRLKMAISSTAIGGIVAGLLEFFTRKH